MQKTRRQIMDILKRRGTATLDEIAREIGLSPVTIRAHLSVLERDDLVASEEVRGRVGRPHFVYSLAEGAEEHFPAVYHVLAHRFLEGFRAVASPAQMSLLVARVAEDWAAERLGRLAGKSPEQRVSEVARIRNEEGAMVDWERCDDGFILHQRHCPASRVAQQHPEVCQVELEYMRRLLGGRVEREKLVQGSGQQCSYRVLL